MIEPAISKERAEELLVAKFGDDAKVSLVIGALYFTQFSKGYPDSSGPLRRPSGQALTNFVLQAWTNDMFGVIFYGDMVLEVSDRVFVQLCVDGKPY